MATCDAGDVTVRGTVYEVSLKGDALQQRQKSDPTRTRSAPRRSRRPSHRLLAASSATAASSSSPSAGSKRKRAPTAFVFAPGAGGAAAREMVKLHGKLEAAGDAVLRVEAPAARALNPASTAATSSRRRRRRAAHPGSAVVLCGASFSCRVVAEVMARDPTAVREPDDRAVRLSLIGQSGSSTDRTGRLRLPADVRACFVEGDKDLFLAASWAADAARGRRPDGGGARVVARRRPHRATQAGALKSRGLTQDLVTESVAERSARLRRVRARCGIRLCSNVCLKSTCPLS